MSEPGKTKPVLLSGDNPQIPLGYGPEPVAAYIDAIPGWKQDVARRLDALIVRAVPDVEKAVKWNTPLYGMGRPLWFMSFHCFTRYLKVGFFNGSQLTPKPPVISKQKSVRYLHLHEGDAMDEAQLIDWVQQASRLPGEKM